MKTMIVQLILSCLILSCSNIDRNKLVKKSDLIAKDYRLFQNTPAWDLAKAVQDGDERKINELVLKKSNTIDYQDSKYGNTLLILAVLNQQIESCEFLLKNKADLNIHNTFDGSSALIEACGSKSYDIKFLEMLIQNGANVNDIETGDRKKGNSTRETPLISATNSGNITFVKLLVENSAEVNYINEFGQSAFSQSIILKKYDIAIYLLQNGVDFKRPIFFRPDFSVPSEMQNPDDKGKPMYLIEVLREDFSDFDLNEYKYKMQIVDFLKSKGIDYRNSPIPEFIKEKAKEKYPKTWQKYLDEY